jgi:transposase
MSLPVTRGAAVLITVGVDTHLDTHVAVALDQLGRRLDDLSVPTTQAGYEGLVNWAEGLGELERVGVEGAGSYGAGLARFLRSRGVEVVEVNRPERKDHRRVGKKSDPIDAEAAARSVVAGTAVGRPKDGDGKVEMIRALRIARRSAVKARGQAANQLKALLVTAPEELRASLRGLSRKELVATAARLRPGDRPDGVVAATKFALRSIARRYLDLSEEITALDEQLDRLVAEAAPALVAIDGIGTDSAATLLTAAGDNPERLRSEAAFASLCGVAPIPASSGKTVRHRLNRDGNRDANRALQTVAVVRMRWDERTRAYVQRRSAEGKTKPEIIRCLKRYICREVYRILAASREGLGAAPDLGGAEVGEGRTSSVRPSLSTRIERSLVAP